MRAFSLENDAKIAIISHFQPQTTKSVRTSNYNANNNNQSGSTDCLAGGGDDTITVPAGTYTLTIAGAGEDAAATGDLDLTSNITINGAGAGSTIIQAGTLGVGGPPNGIDRVFNVIGGTVNISGVTVRNGNGAVFGGGIYSNTGTLTIITNSTISGNSATNGGGIFSNGGTVTLLNSTVSGNSVSGDIGGIYMNNPGTTPNLTITNSTVTGNIAGGVGAGIGNGGTANITNSTIASNLSSSSGGGIYNAGTLTITNSTFSGNSATGGGAISNAGTATLYNTIVANSTSGGNCSGTIANGGNNIDDGTTCGWGALSGSMSSTNPLLGALADNGGPTWTFALLAGSPAINAGNDTICGAAPVNNLDQRGFARGLNGPHCDIGAYEYQDSTAPTVSMSSAAPDPTSTSPIPITVQFSETVTGFVAGDITPGNSAVGNFVAVDGDTYTFDLTPSGQGLVTADIAADVAFDLAGNGNTIATQFSRNHDTIAPTVTMASAAPDPTSTSPIPITVQFSETVTGFTSGDIVPTNGAVSNFAGSGANYTFDLTPAGQGLVIANIAADVATDSAGNGNTIAAQFSRIYITVYNLFLPLVIR